MNQFPVFVNLRGRRVILLGKGAMADAKRRLYERAGASLTDDENALAALAVVAIEDNEEARSAVERLRAQGRLVNAVDRSQLCDYTTPAIVERGPVTIAVGTGGASAGLAKALRVRLEALLPTGLGALAEELDAARAGMKARWPDAADRRNALDTALREGGALDPFAGYAKGAVGRWLESDTDTRGPRTETIRLVSADPDDLTLRQARWLSMADRVVAGAGVPEAIVNRARADAERSDRPGDEAGLTVVVEAPLPSPKARATR